MPNRACLCATNQPTLYPSTVEPDYDPEAQTIASDVQAVPLIWLALFRKKDIRKQKIKVEGEVHSAVAPLTTRTESLANLKASLSWFNSLFREEGRLNEYFRMMAKALARQDREFVTIELDEIAIMQDDERQWHRTVRDFLEQMEGNPSPRAKRMAVEISHIRVRREFPSARLFLDGLEHTEDDLWNMSRLLGGGCDGTGIGCQVPWETRGAFFGPQPKTAARRSARRAANQKQPRQRDTANSPKLTGSQGQRDGDKGKRVYRHADCRGLTTVDGGHLQGICDPYKDVERTYCVGCEDFFPIEDFEWEDTSESLADFRRRMRQVIPAWHRTANSIVSWTMALLTLAAVGFAGWAAPGILWKVVAVVSTIAVAFVVVGMLLEYVVDPLIGQIDPTREV